MSVPYVTTQPMTLDQAIRRLAEIGCTVEPKPECDCCAVVKDPDGNYFHLTENIGSYRTLSFDLSSKTITVAPTQIHDSTTRVMGASYNINDVTRMAELLDMVCEFEDEYHEIMGADMAEPEEEEG